MSDKHDEDYEEVKALLDGAMIWAFPFGAKHIGIAVSAGGDSMALLDLYRRHASGKDVALSVVTVDHGLRPEAAGEARLVGDYCAAHGLAHTVLHWQGAAAKGNLMAAARKARYRLIADWAQATGVDLLALGHTADDQAETVLMALARASGVDGLAGMGKYSDKHGLRFLRPLLSVPRADLRVYLRHQGITWAEDPSNDNPAFERVRMRRALPMLADLGITVEGLGQVAHAAHMAASVVQARTAEEAQRCVSFDRGDLLVSRRMRPPVHPEVMRRIELAALRYVGQGTKPIRPHQMAELDHGLMSGGVHTLAGCIVTQDSEHVIRIAREAGAIRETGAPGALWDGRWRVFADEPGEVRPLGEAGLAQCPDWRATGLPRRSLLAHPGLWQGATLLAAPSVGLANGACAELTLSDADFRSSLLSH